MATEQLRFQIIGDDSQFQRTMNNVNSSLGNTVKSIGAFAKKTAIAGTAIATATGALAIKFTNMGADVQEMQNKFDVVFKGMTKETENWASEFSNAIGRNRNTIKGYLADNQNMFVGMGMTREAGAQMSKQLVETAIDLASFNNLQDDEAVDAMSKAIMGETESAKQLGAVLNDNTRAMAMEALGYQGKFDALTEAQKMEVNYQAILMQSGDAIGDAERSANSYTGQLKALKAKLEETGQSIGMALLPVMTQLVQWVSTTIDKIKEWYSTLKSNGVIDEVSNKIKTFVSNLVTNFNIAVGAIKTFFNEAHTGGQIIKFIAELWGKYGNDIIEVAKLLWNTLVTIFKTIVTVINFIWSNFGEQIKSYTMSFVQNIITVIKGLLNVIQGIFKLISAVLKGDWSGAWNAVKQIVSGAIGVIKGILSQFKNIISATFSGIKTIIINIWNTVFNGMKSVASNALNAIIGKIKSTFSSMYNTVKGITSNIKSALANAFKFTIPKIKLPHISVTGKLSLAPPSVPKVSIKWYKKGGIFNSPTLLGGMNGVGEAGAEAVIPLTNQKYVKPFAQTIADLMGNNNSGINITIQNAVIREDADITKIARQLQLEIDKRNRYKGVLA